MKFLFFMVLSIVSLLPLADTAAADEPLATLVVRENYLPTPPRKAMAATIRDPFNWPEKQEKRSQAQRREKAGDVIARISLDGIIYSPEKPLALISGKILTVGDTVEGYRIAAITPDSITLRRGKTERTIRLPMPSLRLEINKGSDR